MDYLQTRILELVAISSPGHLPDPRIESKAPVLWEDFRDYNYKVRIPKKQGYVSTKPIKAYVCFDQFGLCNHSGAGDDIFHFKMMRVCTHHWWENEVTSL